MRFVIFCHSLFSDWNHGNAHFLRGICRELLGAGHEVRVFEPRNGWSRGNLVAQHGDEVLWDIHRSFPELSSQLYDLPALDLDAALDGADVVLVHEWNDPELVARIGRRRARGGGFRLLFHDTHHRAVTRPEELQAYDISAYDGVLAFGAVIRELYVARGWSRRAWTWHEAADTRLFRPQAGPGEGDLVWIGNWGDGERSQELHDFLIEPARSLGLKTHMYGVRYPAEARAALSAAGIGYGGWLPNHLAPDIFARHRVTVHVPRRPYVAALPGIPTIRVFEALACGIPLVSAYWSDVEGLFRPGQDFLTVRSGHQMTAALRRLLADPDEAAALARSGLETIRARHTCAHRVEELLGICGELGAGAARSGPPPSDLVPALAG
jgi:spore maturation protein CgeB